MGEGSTPEHPVWWHWPVLTSGHLVDRMVDRRISEADLREMLEDAIGVRRGARTGRWVAECRWRGEHWEVVLEPDKTSHTTVAVTAYRIR